MMSGVYIHIPFCRQACIYCNFYFQAGKKQSEIICSALLREIDIKLNNNSEQIDTVYFGGGTPSFIEPESIAKIIDRISELNGNKPFKEVTLEANPDDMSYENLKAWKSMGIQRFSVGVQSFFDKHLKWMNRAHSALEAQQALQLASEMGFELSVDLIFGIPECTDEEWRYSLEKALTYNIDHISCYSLTLEDHTPWKKLVEKNKYLPPDEDKAANQFAICMEVLRENGWIQYEISNYCKPGKMAVHNTSYWQSKPYVGIGPSAHSFNGTYRSWNVSDSNAYIESIEKGIIPEEREELTTQNKHNEYLMTGLRTMWGVDLKKLEDFQEISAQNLEKIDSYIVNGLLRKENQTIFLTDNGKMYADAIASDLFV